MSDETHLVVGLSLVVPSLKQNALMKFVDTLIRPDLKAHWQIGPSLYSDPFERFSDTIKQLPVPECLKRDIRDVVLCLYRHSLRLAFCPRIHSLPPSALKFNVCGDLDVHRTFDDYMDDFLRGSRSPWTYLFQFLIDACEYHQDRCIHWTLCEFFRANGSNLESSLRHARREVNVRRKDQCCWYYDIRFVIEDVDDPVQWISFANMLNSNMELFFRKWEFSFDGNVFSVEIRVEKRYGKSFLTLWSKMTTLQKLEHAEDIFKAALEQSDMYFLIQTMRYVKSSRRVNLIKTNLVSFIMCFLVHPYYRHFLPDLQLMEEDLQLVQGESEHVFDNLVDLLHVAGDYINMADSLIQLWRYVSSRNNSLGDHVFQKIRTLLYNQWNLQDDDKYDDTEEFVYKLRAVFPAIYT